MKTVLAADDGFQRAGLSFPVYATQIGVAKAISRLYFDKVAVAGSCDSHYDTRLDADKAAFTALNPSTRKHRDCRTRKALIHGHFYR